MLHLWLCLLKMNPHNEIKIHCLRDSLYEVNFIRTLAFEHTFSFAGIFL